MQQGLPRFARQVKSWLHEPKLPWRVSHWLYKRKTDHLRQVADRQVALTRPYVTGGDLPHFEVHVLFGHNHVGMTLWCIKSLLHHSGLKLSIVLHEDGTLTDPDAALLEKHLANVRIVRKAEADALMREKLAGFPHCSDYRFSPQETSDHRGTAYNMHIFALRLFDFNLISKASKILVLDCDVLFFRKPAEILEWAADTAAEGCLFSIEQYVPHRNDRFDVTGFTRKDPLPNDANAGLLCFDKRIYNLETIEAWIDRNKQLMNKVATFEQHAYNYLLQQDGRSSPLPDAYSFNYTDDSVSATHFAIKHLFFENVTRLTPTLM